MSDASPTADSVALHLPSSAGDALDNLVSQFSSNLDCYRELVQNAIDAGTLRVEVWMEFIASAPGAGGAGTIAIHVDDFGEGMDESIIDNQLTTLFSSSKENDLTKIGKFGIGFVSVFALKPKAVFVHTGRGGEYWEVVFHEDRSFSKARVDTPLEGTQVTLYIPGDRHRYDELVAGSRKTLERWCMHSDTEVTFEDRSAPEPAVEQINRAFEVEGECVTRAKHEGTELVMAFNNQPDYGFYNRGLTLLYTTDRTTALDNHTDDFIGVALKIKSRYLEHTLSRETVMRDGNFEKAMELLNSAFDGPMTSALLDALGALGATPALSAAEQSRYDRLLDVVGSSARLMDNSEFARQAVLRTPADPQPLHSAYDSFLRDGRVFATDTLSDLVAQLASQGTLVFVAPTRGRGQSLNRLLRNYVGRCYRNSFYRRVIRETIRDVKQTIRDLLGDGFAREGMDTGTALDRAFTDPHDVFRLVRRDDPSPGVLAKLLPQAARALKSIGAGYGGLGSGVLAQPSDPPPLFLVGRETGSLMALPPGTIREPDAGNRPWAMVNRDHPHILSICAQYPAHPALAVYAMAKSLLLAEDRLLHLDPTLMRAAREVTG